VPSSSPALARRQVKEVSMIDDRSMQMLTYEQQQDQRVVHLFNRLESGLITEQEQEELESYEVQNFKAEYVPNRYVPLPEVSYSESITGMASLHPDPEWYPTWMQYRRREDNTVFWEDKFSRCSLDIRGRVLTASDILRSCLLITIASSRVHFLFPYQMVRNGGLYSPLYGGSS
jgi:hypothetical protein